MVTPSDEREVPTAGPPIDDLAEPATGQAQIGAAPAPATEALADETATGGPRPAVSVGDAPADGPATSQDRALPADRRSQLSVSDIAAMTCPFLVSGRGAWRGTKPSSDHRCAAETPPGQPSRDHQKAYCLSERFVACPLHLGLMDRGAGGTRAARPDDGLPGAGSGGRWGLRPTAPIVIEGPPSSLDPRVLVRSRRLGAIALVALMIAAFALVALARLPGLLPGDSTSTATQSPPASEAASGQPDGEATPASVTPAASGAGRTAPPAAPQPTPAGSVQAATATPVVTPPAASPSPPAASPSPQATATARTYVVQRGDTLSSIARRFDTSVEAIAAANGITNPSLIGVGQLLVIP